MWQPTGERIVAETGEHDGAHWLVLLDARGREVRGLPDSSDYIRPSWSPDGRFIFAINYGLGSAIGRWDADGRNKSILRVTGGIGSGRQFQMISFSPSGNRAALLTMSFREMAVATVKDNCLQVVAMRQSLIHRVVRTTEGFGIGASELSTHRVTFARHW